MNRFRFAIGLTVLVSTALATQPAAAFFHLWKFTEFFSNTNGSVQFIEMRNTSNFEHFASGAQIRSLSTGKVFTFPNNLSSTSTANKNLLIATAGFGSLPGGVTPDFTLPSTSFFNPAGDTITLFAGSTLDSRTFPFVPTDGVQSRNYPSNELAVNSPRNFAGASGSVDLASPVSTGDYNGNGTVDAADYTIWRDTHGQSVTAGSGADGDGDGTVNAGDYTFWKSRFGDVVAGAAAGPMAMGAVPELASVVQLATAMVVILMSRRALTWLSAAPALPR